MAQGKITIESGNYKATFSISDENIDQRQDVHIDFEPELPQKEDMGDDAIFVNNISSYLIWYLSGGK